MAEPRAVLTRESLAAAVVVVEEVQQGATDDSFARWFEAARVGCVDVAIELLSSQHCISLAVVDEANEHHIGLGLGTTALHYAAENGHYQFIRAFATQATSLELNACDMAMRTPLYLACQNGHLLAAQELVAMGADPFLTDCLGLSILHAAAGNGHVELTRWLLTLPRAESVTLERDEEELIDSEIGRVAAPLAQHRISGSLVDWLDDCGQSPIFWAASRGCIEVAEILAAFDRKGISPNKSGVTPLHCACLEGNLPAVSWILSLSPERCLLSSIDVQSYSGHTPLFSALLASQVEVVRFMLDMGADPVLAFQARSPSLHIRSDRLDLVQILEGHFRSLTDEVAIHLPMDLSLVVLDYLRPYPRISRPRARRKVSSLIIEEETSLVEAESNQAEDAAVPVAPDGPEQRCLQKLKRVCVAI